MISKCPELSKTVNSLPWSFFFFFYAFFRFPAGFIWNADFSCWGWRRQTNKTGFRLLLFSLCPSVSVLYKQVLRQARPPHPVSSSLRWQSQQPQHKENDYPEHFQCQIQASAQQLWLPGFLRSPCGWRAPLSASVIQPTKWNLTWYKVTNTQPAFQFIKGLWGTTFP